MQIVKLMEVRLQQVLFLMVTTGGGQFMFHLTLTVIPMMEIGNNTCLKWLQVTFNCFKEDYTTLCTENACIFIEKVI